MNAAGISGGVSGFSPEFKEEKENESSLVPQSQKFFRIHGFIIMGDTEVDMAAQGGLHDCGICSIADGVAHGDLVAGFYGYLVR